MNEALVTSHPEVMGGTPVIRGTRVPVSTLFDYLMDGLDVEEFLDHFPTVKRHDALRILENSRSDVLARAEVS